MTGSLDKLSMYVICDRNKIYHKTKLSLSWGAYIAELSTDIDTGVRCEIYLPRVGWTVCHGTVFEVLSEDE